MTVTISLHGLDAVQRRLTQDLDRPMRGASKAVAAALQNIIAPYPRSTAANRPQGPGSRWYERGYGTRWMRVDGSIHGRKTSETLGRRWGIASRGKSGAVLGNIASYAPFVHDDEKQAEALKKIGWVTDKMAVRALEAKGTIDRIVNKVLMKVLGG